MLRIVDSNISNITNNLINIENMMSDNYIIRNIKSNYSSKTLYKLNNSTVRFFGIVDWIPDGYEFISATILDSVADLDSMSYVIDIIDERCRLSLWPSAFIPDYISSDFTLEARIIYGKINKFDKKKNNIKSPPINKLEWEVKYCA